MKILKNAALVVALICGQALYAMSHDNKENSRYMAHKENIENKISLIQNEVSGAQKQIGRAKDPHQKPAIIRGAFKSIKGDLGRIVPLSASLNEVDRQNLFDRLHAIITPLYQSYQKYAIQYGSSNGDIDNMWIDVVGMLDRIIVSKR
jgi:hypothetical protein